MKNFFFSTLILLTTIFSIAQDSWHTYTVSDGLVDNGIKSLAVDSAGNIWIGTENGASVFDGTDFINYNTSDGLANNSILTVFVDSHDNVWFGTMGGGVSKFDGSNWTTYYTTDGLASTIVYSIYEDSNNNMWFGTTSGVSVFDGSTWTTYNTATGLPSNIVSSICEDFQGNMWIGLWMSGIAVYDGTDWIEILESDSLAYYQVTKIFRDQNDRMWIGTTDGISIFSDTATWFANYRMHDGIIDDWVQGIDEDSQGNMWFALYTDYLNNGGSALYDGTDWANYSLLDGLASNNVRDVLVKDDNNIWFGTILGLTKYYSSTDIEHRELNNGNIEIYPNPTSAYLSFDVKNNEIIEQISISDYTGKCIKIEDEVKNTLDISGIKSGLYIMSIKTESGITQIKLIKN